MSRMARDQFFDRFPWVFNLPERPQCRECWAVSHWTIDEDGDLILKECHRPDCSRAAQYDGRVHVVAKRGEA